MSKLTHVLGQVGNLISHSEIAELIIRDGNDLDLIGPIDVGELRVTVSLGGCTGLSVKTRSLLLHALQDPVHSSLGSPVPFLLLCVDTASL